MKSFEDNRNLYETCKELVKLKSKPCFSFGAKCLSCGEGVIYTHQKKNRLNFIFAPFSSHTEKKHRFNLKKLFPFYLDCRRSRCSFVRSFVPRNVYLSVLLLTDFLSKTPFERNNLCDQVLLGGGAMKGKGGILLEEKRL